MLKEIEKDTETTIEKIANNLGEIKIDTESIIEKIVDRWENIGFMVGFPEIKKETLAINFENMFNYLTNDNDEYTNGTNGTFETIIFPIIRRVTSEIPIIFDCRMFTKYILNAKMEEIIIFLDDDIKKIAKTYSGEEKAFELLNINDIPNIDMEAELCASLSKYLIDKLK